MGPNAMLTQMMTDRTPPLPPVTRPVRKLPQANQYAFMTQIDTMGAAMPFARNAEIYGENERADYLYKVLRGSVRTYKLLADGRRQIGGFYLPGDIFGLEVGKEHQFSAEAINDVTVLVVRRSVIVSLAERDCDTARELWSFTGRELNRVQEHLLLLVKTAQQRVASFLLEMSARFAATDAIEL